jgi:hypothetical protein
MHLESMLMKLIGEWWSPDYPEQRAHGYLRIRRSGRPSLYIDSSTSPATLSRLQSKTLQGLVADGTAVTLWFEDFSPLQEAPRSSRDVGTALVGAACGDEGTTLFDEMTYSYEGLGSWSRHPKVVERDEPGPQYGSAVFVPYAEDDTELTIRVDEPETLHRNPDLNVPMIRDGSGHATRVVMITDPPTPLSFHNHLALDLSSLLSFCFQREAHLSSRVGRIDGQIVTVHRRVATKSSVVRPHGSSMIVTCNRFDPALLFEAWWAACRDLYPLPQILAGRYSTRRAFLEHHVISATAALEATYGRLSGYPQVAMDEELFVERKEWHAAHEDNEEFGKLLSNVANRMTLKAKLMGIKSYVGADLIATAGVRQRQWVSDVMMTRNRLAHSGSHVEGVTDGGRNLLLRVDRDTRAVLSLVLCKLLGAEPQALDAAASVLSQRGS